MFRRKDEGLDFEGGNESNTQGGSAQGSSASSGAPAGGAGSASSAAPSAPAARPVSVAQPSQPAQRPAQPSAAAPSPSAPAYRPSNSGMGRAAAPAQPANANNNASAPAPTGQRILTVGHDILLKGEIATCDRLVIQGEVDAKLKEVHTVEIAERGSFTGSAEIENAEISGLFEGNLVVRNRLMITSTGRVRGSIAYGEIEIQRGGELSGEITMGMPAAKKAKKAA